MANCRLGKHPPKVDDRTLRFKDCLKPGIGAPPASYNVLDTVYQNLKINDPAKLFPMDGNDTIGDCTIAALAHASTVYRGLLKTKKIMTRPALDKLYYHLTGGPDTGLNELDVLNCERSNRAYLGNTQQGTWAWWDECVDEAYAILPPRSAKAGVCQRLRLRATASGPE